MEPAVGDVLVQELGAAGHLNGQCSPAQLSDEACHQEDEPPPSAPANYLAGSALPIDVGTQTANEARAAIDIDAEEPNTLHYMVHEELRGDPDEYDYDSSLLRKRRKNARKRLLQHASYAALVEDRIVRLEEVVGRIRTAMPEGKGWSSDEDSDNDSVASSTIVPKTSFEHDVTLKAKAVRMAWTEFTYTYCPDEKKDHAIELCVEKPASYQDNSAYGLAIRRRRQKSQSTESQSSNRVERIRFQSKLLRKMLVDVLGEDVAPAWDRMILRPFKPLFYCREELERRYAELEAQVSEDQPEALLRVNPGQSTLERTSPRDQSGLPDRQEGSLAEEGERAEAHGLQAASETAQVAVPNGAPLLDANNDNADALHSEAAGSDEEANVNSRRSSGTARREYKEKKQRLRLQLLRALLATMKEDLKPELEVHAKCRSFEIKTIKHEDLWHLFAPGDIIYSPKQLQAFQILRVQNGREIMNQPRERGQGKDAVIDPFASLDRARTNPFTIDYFAIDFDGTEFGARLSHLDIEPYEGEKRVIDLELYPIAYGKSERHTPTSGSDSASITPSCGITLREALIERGRKFKEYASASQSGHCEYRGMTIDSDPEMVDSHVIVDTSYYYEKHPGKRPVLGFNDLAPGDPREVRELCYRCHSFLECDAHPWTMPYDDRKIEQQRMEEFVEEGLAWLRNGGKSGHGFNDEHLLLLPGGLWAFVLYSRVWHILDVNKIHRVRKSTESFNQLQIDPLYRRLVESQVTMHSKGTKPVSNATAQPQSDHREDLVRGKGKGLIILLHGAPGVGKTSTAECVAEYTGRPLLSITCGDIGDTAVDVSKHLEYYLNLAHRWGCVMLLDEADVFLSARDRRDMKRNAVVSVFLRILEYYSGILFLTTNKVGTVDEAFKSRIHLSLHYEPLNKAQTREIWKINLNRIRQNKPHVQFEEQDILDWAADQWRASKSRDVVPWNGRQIRNACQTIAALAEFDSNSKITQTHLDSVEKASNQFDEYLRELHGSDDSARAKRNKDRVDDYDGGRQDSRRHDDRDQSNRYDQGYDHYPPSHQRQRSRYSSSRARGNHYSPPPQDRRRTSSRRRDSRNRPAPPPLDDYYDEPRRDRQHDSEREAMPPPAKPTGISTERDLDRRRPVERHAARPDSRARPTTRDDDYDRRR